MLTCIDEIQHAGLKPGRLCLESELVLGLFDCIQSPLCCVSTMPWGPAQPKNSRDAARLMCESLNYVMDWLMAILNLGKKSFVSISGSFGLCHLSGNSAGQGSVMARYTNVEQLRMTMFAADCNAQMRGQCTPRNTYTLNIQEQTFCLHTNDKCENIHMYVHVYIRAYVRIIYIYICTCYMFYTLYYI